MAINPDNYYMRLQKFILFSFIFLLVAGLIFSQSDSKTQTVYAPYPTNIRVGIQGNTVVITWIDSPDYSGAYNVYKSTKLPDASNYKYAELIGKVEKGVQQFSYTLSDLNSYYFFILPVNTQNQAVEIFIPLQNYTLVPVKIETVSENPKPVQYQNSAVLSDFNILSGSKTVEIKFSISNYSGKLYLYRSQKPFINEVSLIEAVQIYVFDVNTVGSRTISYSDIPFPCIQYYWAIVTEQELSTLRVSFFDRKNTSLQAASIVLVGSVIASEAVPRYAPL
ncbi:MAG: hypothetical protein GYA16_15815, partial [Spirochaetes bacterium]|nr:hypothetical protein [Spirochaetota bacterium]